jgi:hypothetical protein
LAIHAEWTKVRTAGGACWFLLAAVVLTIALSAAAAAAVSCSSSACDQHAVKISLTGVYLGQLVIAIRSGRCARSLSVVRRRNCVTPDSRGGAFGRDGPTLRA